MKSLYLRMLGKREGLSEKRLDTGAPSVDLKEERELGKTTDSSIKKESDKNACIKKHKKFFWTKTLNMLDKGQMLKYIQKAVKVCQIMNDNHHEE